MLEDLKKKLPTRRRLAVIPCPLCQGEADLKSAESTGFWTICKNCGHTINEKSNEWLSWYVVSLYQQHTDLTPLVRSPVHALDVFVRAARLRRPLGRNLLDVERVDSKSRRCRIEATRLLEKKDE